MHHGPLAAIIAPSLLSCDFAFMGDEAKRMVDSGADWLHMDIMDGHFVPNISIGPMIVKSLRKHTDAFLDCHCMVDHPLKWIKDLKDAGANQVTFHIEAVSDGELEAVISKIRELEMKVGIAIKPNTSMEYCLERIKPFMERVDLILVMTVEPGFGGQKFMENMMPKVTMLRKLYPSMNIQVDGGLSPSTVDLAAKAGANVIVAGSSVFNSKNARDTIEKLRFSVNSSLL